MHRNPKIGGETPCVRPQPAKSSQESSLPSSSGNNSANNIVFLVTRRLSKRTDPNRNQYVIHQGSISWLWRDGSQHVDWTPRTTAYYNQHIHDNKIPTTIKMNEFLLRKKYCKNNSSRQSETKRWHLSENHRSAGR